MGTRVQSGWHRRLATRLRAHWRLKTAGIVVCISAFMCVYFILLNHPRYPVTEMPLLPLDHWVGFVPWAVVPYASLWIYIGIAPSLLRLKDEMPRYVAGAAALAVIGCGAFYFWPTRVPDFALDWTRWPAVNLLKATDAAGNACPSLHVGFSVLTAIWLHGLLRREGAPRWLHGLNVGWCLLIAWSTMATRQHVALDVGAGALLGSAIALASLYLMPRRGMATESVRL